MGTIKLTIDNKEVIVPEGTTILEASKSVGIKIPTLCFMKLDELHYENSPGSCRICVVEIAGNKKLMPSCKTLCAEGMVVRTHNPRVLNARRTIMELILSNHPFECLTCRKNGQCELQNVASELGIREIHYPGEKSTFSPDVSPAIVRDLDKCIMCRRCETMCNSVQSVGAISAINRGFNSIISTGFGEDIELGNCTYCGQCVAICPVGALGGKSSVDQVLDVLADSSKVVVAQTAPAVRTALGKAFGMESDQVVTGKMVSALRAIGFNYVFDTDFAADLTIMEEGTELLGRLTHLIEGKADARIPLMTSCCPGWVNFVEQNYPELIDNLSTAKSPQQMMGAVIKNYFAKKLNRPRKDIVVVSLMPCLAKKYECMREDMSVEGDPDVNYVLYTRELVRLIRFANVDFQSLPESDFDSPLGESTGAGTIFGATGGVMEAVVRTAYSIYTGKPAPKIDFQELRGFEGIKKATIDFDGVQIKLGIAHGLGNARKLAESILNGTSDFHAVEVMACPGGCIGGGGQPFHHGDMSVIKKRAAALYDADRQKSLRKSHENPSVQKLYADFLGTPCGPVSHRLLHTHYTNRRKIVGVYPVYHESTKENGAICLSASTIESLKTICGKFDNDPKELINILHAVQELVGYLPKEVQEIVAEQLRIPLSKVYGVVTFYSFFTMAPKGKYPISVCLGTACYVRGAEKVLDEFKNLLKIKVGETTADGLFSLDCLRCVGACGFSPVVLVGKKVYVRMTPEKVRDVLNDFYSL